MRPLDSGALSLAEKIAAWLLDNMRDSSGFFLLSAQAFLHCANALHALVSGMDHLRAGALVGRAWLVMQNLVCKEESREQSRGREGRLAPLSLSGIQRAG